MPYIRDKKWKQRGTGIKIADPRQDCYFSPENEGVVDVKWKQVVERLLAHPNEFEVAWDLVGVHFDSEGKQIEPGGTSTSGPLNPTQEDEYASNAPVKPEPKRAKKKA